MCLLLMRFSRWGMVFLWLWLSACVVTNSDLSDPVSMDSIPQNEQFEVKSPTEDLGVEFVKLGLALGEHDGDYVDAYQGPEQWRTRARRDNLSLKEISDRAVDHIRHIQATRIADAETAQRYHYLLKQFHALNIRAQILQGKNFSFDEESAALYDTVPPHHDAAYYDTILDDLDQALPGTGSLSDRVARLEEEFTIPPEKVDVVFRAAIDECRRRTQRYIDLPDHESFTLEYVTNKPWSGYNWFQGNAKSLIQVNIDLPIRIDRAVDLACHEGYPGHHVYNTLLEKHLLIGKGWREFALWPLFSPVALIAEGSANYGIEVAFPGDERFVFEEQVLFDLAELDVNRVREYYRVREMLDQLAYAEIDTARRYLDGSINAQETQRELIKYSLFTTERARQRVAFFDKYRAYVINYSLGRDQVKQWVKKGLNPNDESARWKKFEQLLTRPMLPSQLVTP